MASNHEFRSALSRGSAVSPVVAVAVVAIGPLTIWYSTIASLILGEHFGKKPTPDGLLIGSWLLIGIGLPLLFYSARLVTEVRSDGLYLRFFPFHLSFLRFPLDSIKRSEARPTARSGSTAAGAFAMVGMERPTTSVGIKASSLNSTMANGFSSAPNIHSSSWQRAIAPSGVTSNRGRALSFRSF